MPQQCLSPSHNSYSLSRGPRPVVTSPPVFWGLLQASSSWITGSLHPLFCFHGQASQTGSQVQTSGFKGGLHMGHLVPWDAVLAESDLGIRMPVEEISSESPLRLSHCW